MNNEDRLKQYLEDIGQYSVLTAEEEVGLLKKVEEEKDKEAELKLVQSNLNRVVEIAEKYRENDLNFDLLDLIQEGNLGLIQAVQKYHQQKTHQFRVYVERWIDYAIRKSLDIKDEAPPVD